MADKKAEKVFILEFIDVYRGLPALWDVQCKDYTNRAQKRTQYGVLIEKYRERYPDAEKEDVVKKVNSLRTNFRKELRRIRDAHNSGAEEVQSTLYYFDKLRFLIAQEPPSASMSSIGMPQCVQESEDLCDATDYCVVSGPIREVDIQLNYA